MTVHTVRSFRCGVLITRSFNQIRKTAHECEIKSAATCLRLNTSRTKPIGNRELKSTIVLRGEMIESIVNLSIWVDVYKRTNERKQMFNIGSNKAGKFFLKNKDFHRERKALMNLKQRLV